jgi:hypothetical protein
MFLTDPFLLFVFNLLLGAALGHVLYRSDFCMAGMFRDVFLFRGSALLPSLALLIAAAMALFALAQLAGLILISPPPTYRPPSLATALGGVLFGAGMVLAGGCVVSTLYRMAGGNLAAALAFCGMLAGSLLYAESHPFLSAFRRSSVILDRIELFAATRDKQAFVQLALSLLALSALLVLGRRGKLTVTAYASAYLQPWKAALAVAALNAGAYVFSGWPMGITTAYAKTGAYLEALVAPRHVETLPYFSENTLSAVVSGAVVAGGAAPRMDVITFTEMALALGILAGAFATAAALREFRVSRFPPLRQALSAFGGGALVAYGARIAGGCNLKFIAGSVPLLAMEGLLFAAGMLGGAYAGTVLLKRLVMRI